MRLIFFAPLVFISTTAFSQPDNLIGRWTNGFEFYGSGVYNDSLIVFSGGNLHEGGSIFTVKVVDDNQFIIDGREPNDNFPPSLGKIGDEVDFQLINKAKVLIIKNANEEIHDLLRWMKQYESLEDLYLLNIINFQLAGTYTDEDTNKEIIIYSNSNRINGLAKTEYYKFETDYDYPIEVITFDGGISFWYEKTSDGLDFYEAIKDEDDEWGKGKLLRNLKKTGWINPFNSNDLKGLYTIASEQVLIDGILTKFNKNELRIMRNEIFARHGYKFRSDEMKQYFEKQVWYVPTFDNVNDKLTELEKLNIKLIRRFESK